MSDPTVSVVIPAYNAEDFIAETIQSVLDQTFTELEIIVVDDGSTDKTADVAASYPGVILITQKNAGPAAARNTGIRASRGNLIALLDNDDLWEPTKLERQVALLNENRDIDGAFTLLRHFMSDGERPPASLRSHLLEKDAVGHTPSTLIVRREAFDRVGWFAQEHHAEDADWFFRAKDVGLRFGIVDEALVLKRVRAASITGSPDRVLRGVIASARASIVRQRELVSVLIPAYNGGKYLDAALRSVSEQQVPLEIILVDDGSTDDTRDVVARYNGVRYLSQANQGTAAALNRAVDHARGAFLAFLDQDDRWTDGKLAHQLEIFRSHPDVDMVQGHLRQFVSPEIGERDRAHFEGDGRVEPAPLPGTTLVRRPAFRRVGPFDTRLTIGYFADWMFRAQEAGLRTVMLDEVLLERRLHRANQTSERSSRIEYVRVAKAALDRRRS